MHMQNKVGTYHVLTNSHMHLCNLERWYLNNQNIYAHKEVVNSSRRYPKFIVDTQQYTKNIYTGWRQGDAIVPLCCYTYIYVHA